MAIFAGMDTAGGVGEFSGSFGFTHVAVAFVEDSRLYMRTGRDMASALSKSCVTTES